MKRIVLLIPHLCLLAKRFPEGRWSFLGPGSNKTKWYSTYKERPGGKWDMARRQDVSTRDDEEANSKFWTITKRFHLSSSRCTPESNCTWSWMGSPRHAINRRRRVCKHLSSGWHTQGGRMNEHPAVVPSGRRGKKPPVRRKGGRAGLPEKGTWPPRGTVTTVLTYPGSAPK